MANSHVLDSFELNISSLNFVRGHHIYKEIWTPVVGEELQLQREPSGLKDRFAVVCLFGRRDVGGVPANLAPIFSPFLIRDLIRDFNTITATITGVRVNHVAGLGIEVPCRYKLNGPNGPQIRLFFSGRQSTLHSCYNRRH